MPRGCFRAAYDSVAFRFIAANDGPTTHQRRFLDRIEGLFVEAAAAVLALDGTKVHANASRHSALSWKHACELEARLKAEVAELLALAEAADGADVPDGMSVPEELARREDRLARIAEAKAVIEARAREHALSGNGPSTRRSSRRARRRPRRRAASRAAVHPSRRWPGPGRRTRSQDRTRASCRWPAAASNILWWRPTACWWSPTTWSRPPTTSENRAGAGSARPPSRGAGRARDPAGGQRLLQRGQRERLRRGRDRASLITPGRERHHLSWKDRFAGAPPPPENPTPLEAMTHRLATPVWPATLRPAPSYPCFRQLTNHGRMEPVTLAEQHEENVHLAIRLSRRPDSVPREKASMLALTREQANVLRALTERA